ncbi:MAG: MoxR family ATPase [bacterium]
MSDSSGNTFSPAQIAGFVESINNEIGKVIIGQSDVIEQVLIGLFSRGHILLVGVPGLAKTLLVKTISEILDLNFNRIQFTPDLMPADITGTEILEDSPEGGRSFIFLKGPIFSNIILADEINRTPPKTQAALLQAMQELAVTAGGRTYCLEAPFFVLATQNPIEQEGTYPLPEAQLDRFMLNVRIGYPNERDEARIVKETTSAENPHAGVVISREQILAIQEQVRRVPAADHVINYAVSLVRHTRPDLETAPDFVKKWVSWGAGPRASQFLTLGAKARALVHGKNAASIEDVRALAASVFRHRVIPNFSAEAEGVDSDFITGKLLEFVKPESGRIKD